MSVRSAQSVTAVFTTQHPTTGAATNGDSLPTGTLYVNGTANAATVTVTNIDTGRYKAAVTLPTLAIGDIVDISIAATVNSIAGKGVVWRDTRDIAIDSSGNAAGDLKKWDTSDVGAYTDDIENAGTNAGSANIFAQRAVTRLATGNVVSTTGITTTLDSGATGTLDYHTGDILVITGNTGAGQDRVITAYSSGRVATHAAWVTNPDNTSTYEIRTGRSSATVTGGGDANEASVQKVIRMMQAKDQ